MENEPVFYDCEASCLGGPPIEIGWAFVDPSTGKIHSESHLVKPPDHWDLKQLWDPDAEKLHRISMQQVLLYGRPPLEIASRMNTCLAGRELYSDSPVDDERWLRMIFNEAALAPTFAIAKRNAKSLITDRAFEMGWDDVQLEYTKNEVDRVAPPRVHRAEADARHLAAYWLAVAAPSR
jgi:hypothetical protein